MKEKFDFNLIKTQQFQKIPCIRYAVGKFMLKQSTTVHDNCQVQNQRTFSP